MDKLKELYQSYVDNGLISKKTSFEQFSSADQQQLQSLYDLGVSKKIISQKTDVDTFASAWSPQKKKEPSEVSASTFLGEPSASDTSAEVPAPFGEVPKFDGTKELPKTRQQVIEEQRAAQAQKFADLGSYVGQSIAEGVVSANTYLNRAIEAILLGSNTNYFSSDSAKLLETLDKEKERLQSEYVGKETVGEGFTETFRRDPVTGAKRFAFEFGRQVPQMYALGALGRATMTAEGATAAGLRTGSILAPRTKLVKKIAEDVSPMVPFGLSSAGRSYLEAAEKNPEEDWFDVITNLAVGAYNGTGEIASELMFRTSVDDLIRGGFRKGLVSDIAKSTRPTLQAAKQVGKDVVTEGFQEGLEELAVEFSSNALDALVFGEDMISEKNIYGMADAFLLGSGIGSQISLLSKGPSAIGTANNINKRRNISEEINDLYDVHQDPNTSASEKAVVKGQIINKLAELKQVEQGLASFYEEFSKEDRDKVIKLNQQLSMAQLIYPEQKSEKSKDAIQDLVKAIYSEKTKIESKYDPNIKVYEYDSQKEAGVTSPAVEVEAVAEAQPTTEDQAKESLKERTKDEIDRLNEAELEEYKQLRKSIIKEISNLSTLEEGQEKDIIRNKIKEQLDRYNNLFEKNDSQEEVGVPSPVVEGQAPIEAQPIEGTGQEAPEAGGVLQVPVEEGPEEVAPPAVEETPAAEEVKATLPEGLDRFANIQSYDDVVAILESEPVSVDPNDELNSIFDLVDDYDNMESGPEKKLLETQIALRFSNLLRDKNRSIKYPSSKKNRLESISSDNSLIKQVLYSEVYNSNGTIKSITSRQLINKVKEIKTDIESYLESNAGLNTSTQFLGREDVRPTYFNRVKKEQPVQAETKPEAPAQKPFAEQTDDERIQDLILRSFKSKAFPIIPSIQLKNGEFTRIPLGTTEQELVSALERGEVPTNDGVVKISDIQRVSGDGASVERKEVAPVEELVAEVVTPAVEPTQEAATKVEVAPDGGAFIRSTNASNTYSDLYSFLDSGLLGRVNPNDRAKLVENKKKYQAIADQFKSSSNITLLRAKNILTVLNSFVPQTQKELDLFNKAYAQAENMFEQLKKADKTEGVFKTKKEIIATISRQRKLSTRQKETLIAVVNSIQSDRLFNMNFQGDESFYQFAINLLKANEPASFVHEIGHWGYYNLLTSQERIEYMNYVSQKFMGKDVEGLVFPEKIPYKGRIATSGTNSKDNYQEYFAVQFEQWFANKVGVPEFLERIFDQLGVIVENLITLFKEKGYNPDMVKYFDKIIDTTKFGMTAKEVVDIDSKLIEDEKLADETFGNSKELADEAVDQNKVQELDMRQDTLMDKAKKAWVSMWWNEAQGEIRRFKEQQSSLVWLDQRKIKAFNNRLTELLKGSDKETLTIARDLLGGTANNEQIAILNGKKNGPLIFAQVNEMRNFIDSLTESILFSPSFNKLTPGVQDTMIDNLGTYLRSSYRFWKDKKFFPSKDLQTKAVQEVFDVKYSKEFARLIELFNVVGLGKKVSALEDLYNETKQNIIEEERSLPVGEKTSGIKAMIANLDEIGKELREKRKTLEDQAKLMKKLVGSSEPTPENIKKFEEMMDDYVADRMASESQKLKEEARDEIKAYLGEAKKLRESSDFKSGKVSSSSIKIPSQEFKRKKELLPSIKALLGEETDPIIKFSDTAVALANIKHKGDMIYKISRSFKGKELIKNEATKSEIASGEYRIVTDKFSPLNGKYVARQVFDAITDPNIYEAESWFGNLYFDILKFSRKSKTVWNPPGWGKNLRGGWFTMMANGVVNFSAIKDLKRRGELLFNNMSDQEIEQEIIEAANEGLMGQSVDANLIGGINLIYSRSIDGEDTDVETLAKKVGKKTREGGARLKGFDEWLSTKYGAIDDFTKLVIFRHEKESFAKKLYGKSYESLNKQQQIEVRTAAAETVKRTTPTWSKLPPVYYKIARTPIGDFLGFDFESIRSFLANFTVGYLDLQKGATDKSLSNEQRSEYLKSGSRRLAGTAMIYGLGMAFTELIQQLMLGDDDELSDDLNSLSPDWAAGHKLIFTGINKDGVATFYDYTLEDPYAKIFDLTSGAFDPNTLVNDYLSPNMAIGTLYNMAKGMDHYGRPISNSYDPLYIKAAKTLGYGAKETFVPPFVTSNVRDEIRAYESGKDQYDALDAIGRVSSRAFIRDYKVDIGKQMYYTTKAFASGENDYSDLSGLSRSNRLRELDEIARMYRAIGNIAVDKENNKLYSDATKNIKRNFSPAEEWYILYGYEIPEKQ